MLKKMEQAKAALSGEETTFAAVSVKGELRTSTQKGIAPMMEILTTEPCFLEGAFVADRVIGKAAAFLLIKGEIAHLYAKVISIHAAEALEKNNIPFEYDKMVPYIINRTKDGRCPFEASVLEETDCERAYLTIQKNLKITGRK